MNKLRVCGLLVFILLSANVHALRDVSKFKVKPAPEDLESFAYQLQDFMSHGETILLSESIDMEALVDEVFEALTDDVVNGSPVIRKQMLLLFHDEIKASLVSRLSNNADWDYIHHRVYKGDHYLTYYVEFGGMAEYIEFNVNKINDDWFITDWYFYGSNIWASEGTRRIFELIAKAKTSTSKEEKSNIAKIFALSKRKEESFQLFNSLPEAFKDDRIIQGMVFVGILGLPTEKRFAIIKNMLPFTEKWAFSYLKTEYYYHQREYKTALSYIRRLNKNVGGYYYARMVEAELLFHLEEKEKAIKIISDLVKKHDVSGVYIVAFVVLARQGEFELSLQFLDALKADFDHVITEQDLAALEGMESFLNSDVYQQWKSQ